MSRYIISASRRTDIAHFYTPWFMQRVREGYVMVRNPRNPKHVMHVSLRPDDVIAIVFWSRDYRRLLEHLPELDDRGFIPFFHLTFTGYGPPLEASTPRLSQVVEQMQVLSARYGRDRLVWRYDPVVVSTQHTRAEHEKRFLALARELAPLTGQCVVSLLDRYPSTNRELGRIEQASQMRYEPPGQAERVGLAQTLGQIGREAGLYVCACCEPELQSVLPAARCIDAGRIAKVTGVDASALKESPTRKGCGCAFARDIGAYHTCAHGCAYCYANESPARAKANAKAVNPSANTLGPEDLQPAAPQSKQLQLPASARTHDRG